MFFVGGPAYKNIAASLKGLVQSQMSRIEEVRGAFRFFRKRLAWSMLILLNHDHEHEH
jgi:hypothetical protein